MDIKFHPAMNAIKNGDVTLLRTLVQGDPSLATGRSSRSHPTLLQCLVLDAREVPNQIEMAKVLVDAGAEINAPLVAAASGNNKEAAAFLIDLGAAINGSDAPRTANDAITDASADAAGKWSPLEEALYWGNDEVRDFLVERGASVHNLRIAAGLGRLDVVKSFFKDDGSLRLEAGEISWPFQNPPDSNHLKPKQKELQAVIDSWSNEPQHIINNAFIYACMHGHIETAQFLLEKGANVNSFPTGFHYPGTPLHNAAGRGQLAMVKFLIAHGADVNAKDVENQALPAGWAAYGGHREVKEYLESL